MRLVVDSNILFAALIRDSFTRRIFSHLDADFFTISVNDSELAKYKTELMQKARMNETSLNILLEQLTKKCIRIDDRAIMARWAAAKPIIWKIDPKDTPFIAAALATGADIWSDDLHFSRQNRIKIWKTRDLAKLLR